MAHGDKVRELLNGRIGEQVLAGIVACRIIDIQAIELEYVYGNIRAS